MKDRFPNINTYRNETPITKEFIKKWVSPYYMNLIKSDSEWVQKMISIKGELTDEVILKNLGDRGWRTRQTGAYFSAIKNKTEFTEIIGNHFLKSEVFYAGKQYAITLAGFGTSKSIEYLNEYLRFYLERPELEYDQREAIQAIKYIDEEKGSEHSEKHIDSWKKFCEKRIDGFKTSFTRGWIGKQNESRLALEKISKAWDGSISTENIRNRIKVIEQIKTEANML